MRTHSGLRPYHCPDCTKTFARADALQRHHLKSCKRRGSQSGTASLDDDVPLTTRYLGSVLPPTAGMGSSLMLHPILSNGMQPVMDGLDIS
jgi:hypothetical protein